jgi:hypothetical protein
MAWLGAQSMRPPILRKCQRIGAFERRRPIADAAGQRPLNLPYRHRVRTADDVLSIN